MALAMKDQRKHTRFPAALNAKYSMAGKTTKYACMITDINRDGLKVVLQDNGGMQVGTSIKFSINVPTANSAIKSEATVLWIQEITEPELPKRYVIGCRFSSIKPKDQWKLLDYAYDS
jgi:c-di-GMP-binding flagellar brake protein YcgR